jgi:sporulation-control protein spo0M
MVGVGAPKVEVKLLKTQASMQESVKGSATFTGGEYPATIDEIVLRMLTIEEIKEKDKKKESTEKVGKITFNDYLLEPKEVIVIPFQIKIPKDNLITSTAIKHYVQVELVINGQNVSGACEIHIL